jgi:hypothetical protein
MVGVVFHATGQPVFHCLFCGISRPMFCHWWFRWAVGHNVGHQGELQILRQSDRDSNEIFWAMIGRPGRSAYLQPTNSQCHGEDDTEQNH